MNCALCNGKVLRQRYEHQVRTKAIGLVIIPNIEHLVCQKCGDVILRSEEAQKVIDFIEETLRSRIRQLPIGDFITTSEVVEILGITKQALSKNKRIKRGFIYGCEIDGRKYYYKPSVIAFKESNDGRIPLIGTERDLIHEQLPEGQTYTYISGAIPFPSVVHSLGTLPVKIIEKPGCGVSFFRESRKVISALNFYMPDGSRIEPDEQEEGAKIYHAEYRANFGLADHPVVPRRH